MRRRSFGGRGRGRGRVRRSLKRRGASRRRGGSRRVRAIRIGHRM